MSTPETVARSIEVVANGRVRQVAAGRTVVGFLRDLELDPDVVVVERNGAIVARERIDEVRLEAGDELEIVHIVGGG